MNLTILISVVTGLCTAIWAVWQYLDTRKREQKLKEFEIYHKLIKELVQAEETQSGKEKIFIDRQSAIVYELRHFKRYYPLSYRTLISLKWIKRSISTQKTG